MTFALCLLVFFSAGSAQGGRDAVPAAPEEGGPRYWQVKVSTNGLHLRDQPSTAGQIVSRYVPGTVLNNLGCRSAAGRVWCDVQALGGGARGYVAAEFLEPAMAPHGAVLMGADDSAARAGQGAFDATGPVPCAKNAGQPMGSCQMGVARGGGGDATVVVTHYDGTKRAIFFQLGKTIGTDVSQADGYGELRSERQNGLTLIRVGNERYEIPDAVVFGG
jgi:hypothetical protein